MQMSVELFSSLSLSNRANSLAGIVGRKKSLCCKPTPEFLAPQQCNIPLCQVNPLKYSCDQDHHADKFSNEDLCDADDCNEEKVSPPWDHPDTKKRPLSTEFIANGTKYRLTVWARRYPDSPYLHDPTRSLPASGLVFGQVYIFIVFNSTFHFLINLIPRRQQGTECSSTDIEVALRDQVPHYASITDTNHNPDVSFEPHPQLSST